MAKMVVIHTKIKDNIEKNMERLTGRSR
jgi:hypothetical protein